MGSECSTIRNFPYPDSHVSLLIQVVEVLLLLMNFKISPLNASLIYFYSVVFKAELQSYIPVNEQVKETATVFAIFVIESSVILMIT